MWTVAWGVAVILEGLAWRAWLGGQAVSGLALHLVSGALVGLAAGLRTSTELRRSWGGWAAVMALTIPGLGFLAGLIAPTSGAGAAVEELKEYTRPPLIPQPPRSLTLEEQLAEAMVTEMTLVKPDLGDVRVVRSLVESVPEFGDAVKVRRLLALLKDPASDAYHMAAAKVSRLQEHFALLIFREREQLALEPDLVEAHAKVAEVYVSYLKSGLLEGVLADFYYKLAVERFVAAARLDPENPHWQLRVAELHRRNGRYSQALETCAAVLERFPDHMEARMRIVEIYYYGARLGLAEATRHFLMMLGRLRAEIDPSRVIDPWLRGAAYWWFSKEGEPPRA